MQPLNRPIPTPLFVRWQRLQNRLVPFLAVVLGAAAAWRLWREAPRITAIGQVDIETLDVRAPASGEEADPPPGKPASPRLIDSVAAGQVLARVRNADGTFVDVIAPVGGKVVKAHFHPGQAVVSGQTLFTIAGDHGLSITTYVRSNQRVLPQPGMAVDIREQSDAGKSYHAIVERVGPQYEPIPSAQLRDRKTEEWGLPVIIPIPHEANLTPGELVYIGWLPTTTAQGG